VIGITLSKFGFEWFLAGAEGLGDANARGKVLESVSSSMRLTPRNRKE